MNSKQSAWHSFRLQPTTPGGEAPIVGALGGHPRGVGAASWPACAVCGNPMCFMGQLDAGPWLSMGSIERISFFICHATGGRCEDWDASKGSNALLVHHSRDDNLYDGPPTVRVYPKRLLTVEEAYDEKAYLADCTSRKVPVRKVVAGLRYDKIGGCAAWQSGDETPQSPTGQGPMRLVAQLTTSIVGFDITDKGVAYLFIDPYAPEAKHGRMLWQAG